MFEEIAPGFYTADHQVADGKNVIIFDERRALVVDVCLTPAEAEQTAQFVRSKGYAPDRVLLTHGHTDHVLGGPAFRMADVFAHVRVPDTIRRHLKPYAERKGIDYSALLEQALWPTIMFSDEIAFVMTNRRLRVFPTPGHSNDSVSIYSADERLLVASDTVATGIVPVVTDGDSHQLEKSLSCLLAMEIDVLVSGHGPVLYGADRIQEHLRWSIGYLRSVRDAVRAALAHGERDAETIAHGVDYDIYIGDRLPEDKHDMRRRHRDTVKAILREELAAGAS